MRRVCAICGARLIGLDGRYKYCSEACALEGHRRICRENFRRRYWVTHREQELARNRHNRQKNKAVAG